MKGYLKVVEKCDACGEPLGEYRAADGPAFFTITIVMLLLIPLIGFSWTLFRPDPLTLLVVLTVFITLLTLILLRCVKGHSSDISGRTTSGTAARNSIRLCRDQGFLGVDE